MAQLFLDANIILDFYRFGKDDLSEIQKLVVLAKDDDVELLITEHLVNEISRMREAELAKSFSEFSALKFSPRTPNYCEDLPEYMALKEALKATTKAHNALVEKVKEKIDERKLKADVLIGDLLEAATVLEHSDEVLELARTRTELGNPPGKNGNIGDAIHWESLIAHSVNVVDLVSRDKDFESELSAGKLKSFLEDEWRNSKGVGYARIRLFKSLTAYFKARFPSIEISSEEEKRELISQLENSGSFATTHHVIGQLSVFTYFTRSQRNRLFSALVHNSQVGAIGTDQDVNDFFLRFQEDAWLVDDDLHEMASVYLGVDERDFFFPF